MVREAEDRDAGAHPGGLERLPPGYGLRVDSPSADHRDDELDGFE